MFCSDTLTISQGSPFVLSPQRTRRWLLFASFTLACVSLGSSILPLCPSPFPNSGHYPEFPFIHLSSLLFPCTSNPQAFALLYFPAYSFFPLETGISEIPGSSFTFGSDLCPSLGSSCQAGVQQRRQDSGEHWRTIPYLCSPGSSSRPEDSTALPVFLSSSLQGIPADS